MYCTNFTYADDSALEHGVMICSFNGSGGENINGGKAEITTVKAPNSNQWLKINAVYNEPLSFSFEICKNPHETIHANADFAFSPEEQVDIRRWLERKEFHYLSFDADGMEDIYFFSQIKVTEQISGNRIVGYRLEVLCDAPWGWSEERVAELFSKKKNGIETGVVQIFDASDEIGAVVPTVALTALSDGKVEIYNDSTSDSTIIKNCSAGEVITLKKPFRIESSMPHEHLADDFNWVFPRIQNTNLSNQNIFELENCTARLQWREPRKAVM